MSEIFPSPVPEIPVSNFTKAAGYYVNCLGFQNDWGGEDGGIGQVSRGNCRLFLTNQNFRASNPNANSGPVIIWLNLNSKQEVNELYEIWNSSGARIFYKPESKPWHLHEFAVLDLDGNVLRVFYDFAWELREQDGPND